MYVGGGGHAYRAHVVYFDPDHDVAVLWVPDLPVRPLAFGSAASAGTPGAAIGYPGDGPLTISPARVRGTRPRSGRTSTAAAGWCVRSTRCASRCTRATRAARSSAPTGRVLGVVFAASREDPETGYALTAEQVDGAARAARDEQADVATGRCT